MSFFACSMNLILLNNAFFLFLVCWHLLKILCFSVSTLLAEFLLNFVLITCLIQQTNFLSELLIYKHIIVSSSLLVELSNQFSGDTWNWMIIVTENWKGLIFACFVAKVTWHAFILAVCTVKRALMFTLSKIKVQSRIGFEISSQCRYKYAMLTHPSANLPSE